MFMLCCFSKWIEDELCDRVYHVFEVENKKYNVDFVFDPVFRSFSDKGYSWSAVPFPKNLIDTCGFDVTKCVQEDF